MNAIFPQFSETGIWRVDFVSLTDALGNVQSYYTTALAQLGFPTKLVGGDKKKMSCPRCVQSWAISMPTARRTS